MNQMTHPGKTQKPQLELQLDQVGPKRDLAYYVGICNEFQRFHGSWPTYQATGDDFLAAGIRGYDARRLMVELTNPGLDLAHDPAFQELQLRCLRDGGSINLSALHPDYRVGLPQDAIAALFDTISLAGNTSEERSRGARQEQHGTIWLNTPIALREEAASRAGFDPSDHTVRMNGYQLRVAATAALRDFVDRAGMVYGSDGDLSAHYYLEVIHDALHVKYQSILGGRMAATIDTAGLTNKLVHAYSNDAVLAKCRKGSAPRPTGAVRDQGANDAAPTIDAELRHQIGLLLPEGQSLKLPAEHLTRYQDIKRALEKAGGRYRPNKQQFDFENGIDPAEVLEKLIGGEDINFKKHFQFFATSPALAREICHEAGPLEGLDVLEPSAGDGAIADIAREMGANVSVIELWNVNAQKLRAKGYDPVECDFLSVTPDQIGMFDAIIANPPFTKNQDIDHFIHMTRFLKPGGSMSVIMSSSWTGSEQSKHAAFREFLETQDVRLTPIESGAFKDSGTSVATVRVTLRNFQPEHQALAAQRPRRP